MRLSIRQSFREQANPTLRWILLAATALVVALLTVPGPRDAFGFGPVLPTDWIVATLAGFAGVSWFELYKRRLGGPRKDQMTGGPK